MGHKKAEECLWLIVFVFKKKSLLVFSDKVNIVADIYVKKIKERHMIKTKDPYMDLWYELLIQFKYNKQYPFTESLCFDYLSGD